MSSPAVTSSRNLPANGENARLVAREFARALIAHGIEPRPAIVRKLAERFVADGWSHPSDVAGYVHLWYADPTGETAAANVDRSRRTR